MSRTLVAPIMSVYTAHDVLLPSTQAEVTNCDADIKQLEEKCEQLKGKCEQLKEKCEQLEAQVSPASCI